MIGFPWDRIPTLRPVVHLCTAAKPWDRKREPKFNEEVCHPDAKLESALHNLFRCPHCKGYFKQERPK